MINYEIYKIMHLTGLFLLITGLSSTLVLSWAGVLTQKHLKKFSFITHGVGLLFILVSGFGLLARLGLARESMPLWIYGKLTIWGLFAIAISVLKRKGTIGWPLYFVLIGLFITASYLAIYKLN